tara:strand:+ start:143 stop:1216 length:1074 start_codon:yes stop_codon:yes gene_type:complete
MYVHIERIYNTVARNLGLKDYSSHINSWVEWAFEAELLIGSRDTFEEIESTFTATGEAATGTITFTANPSYGDSITLNGVTIFFRDNDNSTGLNQQNETNTVRIQSTLAETLTELAAELNGTTTTNTASSPGLVYANLLENCTYTVDSTTLTITADEVGLHGNKFTLSSNEVNAKCSGSHLTGGKGIYANQQLRLPDNLVKLLGVRVGKGDTKHKHRELFKPTAVHKGRVGMNDDETDQKSLRYYVRGNRLNVQHDEFIEITIVYSAYPTDSNGFPMIKESHATAVAQYIMWQYKNIEFINGQLPMYIVKEIEKRWYFLCSKARGDDNMPTSEELKQIGRIWNTLVPLNNNRGLIDF